MPKAFHQTSWLGIEFCDLGIELDRFALPRREFYDVIYSKILHTYPAHSDLPLEWRLKKKSSADFLLRFITKDSSLFSYGCGVGFLESCLMDSLGKPFFVSDFSPIILKYRPDLDQYFLAIEELENCSFSQILLSQVSYALSDSELLALFQKLHNCLEIGGTLIVSYYSVSLDFRAVIAKFFAGLRSLGYSYRKESVKSNSTKPRKVALGQLWGFHRSKQEMIDICTAIDFKVVDFCEFNSESFFILKKI